VQVPQARTSGLTIFQHMKKVSLTLCHNLTGKVKKKKKKKKKKKISVRLPINFKKKDTIIIMVKPSPISNNNLSSIHF
jgi:hypothetical protein